MKKIIKKNNQICQKIQNLIIIKNKQQNNVLNKSGVAGKKQWNRL